MKILITGGTGFVGSYLTFYLLKKKCQVVLLCRNPKKALSFLESRFSKEWAASFSSQKLEIEAHPWDVETGSLPPEEALKNLNAVVHLAGFPIAQKRWNQKVMRRIYDSRIQGTRLLMQGLEKYYKKNKDQNLETFISASAIGYYGWGLKNEKISEVFPPSKEENDFLSNLCVEWENEVKKGLKEHFPSPRKICIRISNVLGQEGGILKEVYPLFKRNLGAKLGSGKQFMSWIHIEDLIRMIDFCLEKNELEGPVNAAAPYPVTNLEFTKLLAQVLKKKAYLSVPPFFLFLSAGKISKYILASLRVYPDKVQKLKFQFLYPQLKNALEEIYR